MPYHNQRKRLSRVNGLRYVEEKVRLVVDVIAFDSDLRDLAQQLRSVRIARATRSQGCFQLLWVSQPLFGQGRQQFVRGVLICLQP